MKTLLITLLIILSTSLKAEVGIPETIMAQGGTGYQINELRTFEVTSTTSFMMDGTVIPQPNAQGGTGYKIRYSVSNTNPNLTTGKLEEVDFINIYKGPVLSKAPFNVFNIDALVNNKTHYANGLTLNSLSIGDSVLISGYVDNLSSANITRIEKVDSLSEWKLSGYVENLSGNQFSINNQQVYFSPNMIGACNANFDNGEFVEIFADPIMDFQANDVIDTVTLINCVDRSLRPLTADGTVIIEGMIGAVTLDGAFSLSGQQVEVDQMTRYIRGRAEDIQERIKIEVEGTVDDISGVVTADKIRFLDERINLTIPVNPVDYNFPVFNVAGISLQVPPQIVDPDGVIANGLVEPTQIQFKGYNYGDGEVFITRINVRGSVDFDEVNVSGVVSAIDGQNFDIFGVGLDTTGSLFFDNEGVGISSVEFFDVLVLGVKVKIEGARLESSTGKISGGMVSLDELITNKDSQELSSKNGDQIVLGVGHITGPQDEIFGAGFE